MIARFLIPRQFRLRLLFFSAPSGKTLGLFHIESSCASSSQALAIRPCNSCGSPLLNSLYPPALNITASQFSSRGSLRCLTSYGKSIARLTRTISGFTGREDHIFRDRSWFDQRLFRYREKRLSWSTDGTLIKCCQIVRSVHVLLPAVTLSNSEAMSETWQTSRMTMD